MRKRKRSDLRMPKEGERVPRTDAQLRRAIREEHSEATTIVIAQRISSILSLDHILVLEEGRMIGYGTHEELLEACPTYQDIYRTQMGEVV